MYNPVAQFETRRRASDEQLALLREVELARAARVRRTPAASRVVRRVAAVARLRPRPV